MEQPQENPELQEAHKMVGLLSERIREVFRNGRGNLAGSGLTEFARLAQDIQEDENALNEEREAIETMYQIINGGEEDLSISLERLYALERILLDGKLGDPEHVADREEFERYFMLEHKKRQEKQTLH